MQVNTSPTGQGVAGEALAAYRAVKFNTSGLLVYADAGDKCVGVTQEAFASGATATYFRPIGGWLHEGSGTLAVADYVKLANDGVIVVESSATTPTAFTIGQVRVARATGLPSEVEAC